METIVSRTEESFVLVRSSYGVLSPSSSIDVIVSRYANKMEKDFFLNLLGLLLSRPSHHNDHSLFEPDPDLISTVYNILPKNDLPSGLLPDAVTNFTLSDDGQLFVYLPKPCKIEFDYLVRYDKTVSGCISYGSITELEGIQVKRLFIWLDVYENKVDLFQGWVYQQEAWY
uniref:Uncharacterized protein n=1 Tax=Brassica oleracea var. oleracea TaxID=109376 RepID=A0A0D3CAU2_BRAOL